MEKFDVYESVEKDVEKVLKLESTAKKTVLGFTTAAATTGAVPIPFADMPLLLTEQIAMMTSICKIYGLKVKKDGLKMLVTQIIGAGGAAMIGKTVVTNLLKCLPGGGSIAGGAISATTAGTITYALGITFIGVCNEIHSGKLSEEDMYSRKTAKEMKKRFKKNLKKRKKEDESES